MMVYIIVHDAMYHIQRMKVLFPPLANLIFVYKSTRIKYD